MSLPTATKESPATRAGGRSRWPRSQCPTMFRKPDVSMNVRWLAAVGTCEGEGPTGAEPANARPRRVAGFGHAGDGGLVIRRVRGIPALSWNDRHQGDRGP